MTLPENVCPIKFYNSAKTQGVKVTSRYRNVSVKKTGNKLLWLAEIRRTEGRSETYVLRKVFPFTVDGERQAAEFIINHKEEIPPKYKSSKKIDLL